MIKDNHENKIDVVLGLQWGDEGKGKIVDAIAEDYDIVARFQGGSNAGHTVFIGDQKVVLHTVPSGILGKATNLIGANVVLDPVSFKEEIEEVERASRGAKNRLVIAKESNLVLPTHKLLDKATEESRGVGKIGTTLRGIGPAYMDKVGRMGIRSGHIFGADFMERYQSLTAHHRTLLVAMNFTVDEELFNKNEKDFFDAIEFLKTFTFVECSNYIHAELAKGKRILGEGAQASMLDIDHGFTYPFVTSSNTIAAGVCTGLGVAPQKIGRVIGISKAYSTRVGSGPFPSRAEGEMEGKLREWGGEYGATTGRPRGCGWLDLVALKRAVQLSGVTDIAMTKFDILSNCETIPVCTSYTIDGQETMELPFESEADKIVPNYTELPGWQTNIRGARTERELPEAAMNYVAFIEQALGVRISIISTGPERSEMIIRDNQ
ncbi:MAG: adenylosuccinate synthase [Candidatus Pacebacteria bacterium]|nr:adenylosuccinate synthase [Candidatus Paceibacterota bacterium]